MVRLMITSYRFDLPIMARPDVWNAPYNSSMLSIYDDVIIKPKLHKPYETR
jgi:hypothetical protein